MCSLAAKTREHVLRDSFMKMLVIYLMSKFEVCYCSHNQAAMNHTLSASSDSAETLLVQIEINPLINRLNKSVTK